MEIAQIASGACFEEWHRKKAEQEKQSQQSLLMYVMANPRSDEDSQEERLLKTKCQALCKSFIKYHRNTEVMLDYSARHIDADVMVETRPLAEFLSSLEATCEKPWAALADHAMQWARYRSRDLENNMHNEFEDLFSRVGGDVARLAKRETAANQTNRDEHMKTGAASLRPEQAGGAGDQRSAQLEKIDRLEAERMKHEEKMKEAERLRAEAKAEIAAEKERKKQERLETELLKRKQIEEARKPPALRSKQTVPHKSKEKESERRKKIADIEMKKDAERRAKLEADERKHEAEQLRRKIELMEKEDVDKSKAFELKMKNIKSKEERDRLLKERQVEQDEMARVKAEIARTEREARLLASSERADQEAREKLNRTLLQKSKALISDKVGAGTQEKYVSSDPCFDKVKSEEKVAWGYGLQQPKSKVYGSTQVEEAEEDLLDKASHDVAGNLSNPLQSRASFMSDDHVWKPGGVATKCGASSCFSTIEETGPLYQTPEVCKKANIGHGEWKSGGVIYRAPITQDLLQHDVFNDKQTKYTRERIHNIKSVFTNERMTNSHDEYPAGPKSTKGHDYRGGKLNSNCSSQGSKNEMDEMYNEGVCDETGRWNAVGGTGLEFSKRVYLTDEFRNQVQQNSDDTNYWRSGGSRIREDLEFHDEKGNLLEDERMQTDSDGWKHAGVGGLRAECRSIYDANRVQHSSQKFEQDWRFVGNVDTAYHSSNEMLLGKNSESKFGREHSISLHTSAEKNLRRGSTIGTATAWESHPVNNPRNSLPSLKNSQHDKLGEVKVPLALQHTKSMSSSVRGNRMSKIEIVNPNFLSLEVSFPDSPAATTRSMRQSGPGILQSVLGSRQSELIGKSFTFAHVGLRVAALIDGLIPDIVVKIARSHLESSSSPAECTMATVSMNSSRRVIALIHEGLFGDTTDRRKGLNLDGSANDPCEFLKALRERSKPIGFEKDEEFFSELLKGDEQMLQKVLNLVHGEMHRQMSRYMKLIMQRIETKAMTSTPTDQPTSSSKSCHEESDLSAEEKHASEMAVVEMTFAHTMTQRLSVARPSYRQTSVQNARASDDGSSRHSFIIPSHTAPAGGWGARQSFHHLNEI